MVSDWEYQQILSDYETRKAQTEEAEIILDALEIKASSEAGKSDSGKSFMKITWTPDVVTAEDLLAEGLYDDSETGLLTEEDLAQILPQDAGLADWIDGYEVHKSTAKSSGYKRAHDTKDGGKLYFKNTSGLKKGTRYYYKVRAYKLVGEEKIYSEWSNITYRKAK